MSHLNMKRVLLTTLTALTCALPAVPRAVAQDCSRDAMLVFDGSASMAELGFDQTAPTSANLTVHVIGFRVVADPFAWDSPEAGIYTDGSSIARCISDQTGGMYVATDTVDELTEALRKTLGCALIG